MLSTKISDDERVPLYQRLANEIRKAILNGTLNPGDGLPEETELVEHFNVPLAVVQSSLETLVSENILEKVQDKGVFVRQLSLNKLFCRFFRLKDKGDNFKIPSSKILSRQIEPLPEEIARELNVAPATAGIAMLRLRLSEGVPVMVEKIWLVFEEFKELMKLEEHKIDFLFPIYYQICGQFVTHIEDAVTVELATPETSHLLEIATDTPVLVVDRLTKNGEYKPLEWRRCWINTEQLIYQTETK